MIIFVSFFSLSKHSSLPSINNNSKKDEMVMALFLTENTLALIKYGSVNYTFLFNILHKPLNIVSLCSHEGVVRSLYLK